MSDWIELPQALGKISAKMVNINIDGWVFFSSHRETKIIGIKHQALGHKATSNWLEYNSNSWKTRFSFHEHIVSTLLVPITCDPYIKGISLIIRHASFKSL